MFYTVKPRSMRLHFTTSNVLPPSTTTEDAVLFPICGLHLIPRRCSALRDVDDDVSSAMADTESDQARVASLSMLQPVRNQNVLSSNLSKDSEEKQQPTARVYWSCCRSSVWGPVFLQDDRRREGPVGVRTNGTSLKQSSHCAVFRR